MMSFLFATFMTHCIAAAVELEVKHGYFQRGAGPIEIVVATGQPFEYVVCSQAKRFVRDKTRLLSEFRRDFWTTQRVGVFGNSEYHYIYYAGLGEVDQQIVLTLAEFWQPYFEANDWGEYPDPTLPQLQSIDEAQASSWQFAAIAEMDFVHALLEFVKGQRPELLLPNGKTAAWHKLRQK